MSAEKVHFTSLNLNFPTFQTCSYLNLSSNTNNQHGGALWQLQVKKSRKTYIMAYKASKIHLSLDFFFLTSNFDASPFLSQLTLERDIYFKQKLYLVLNVFTFEISIMQYCEIKIVCLILYGTSCRTSNQGCLAWLYKTALCHIFAKLAEYA